MKIEKMLMGDCFEILDILCEYILPSYPDAVHWFLDKVVGNNEYNILPLKKNENILGVAITKNELLCTFVLKKEYRGKGYGAWFINKLNVKYVKSKNEKLKNFFNKNNVMFILDKRKE